MKKGRKLIKEQLDKAITINQLITHLKTLPPNLYIGRSGHFGEGYLMNKDDFSYINEVYISPSGYERDGHEQNIKILDLCIPNIGPEPD